MQAVARKQLLPLTTGGFLRSIQDLDFGRDSHSRGSSSDGDEDTGLHGLFLRSCQASRQVDMLSVS